MKRFYVVLFLILLLTSNLYSQDDNQNRQKRNINTKITGRVLDSETDKPLEAVAIQLYSTKDTTKLVSGTSTDAKGNFTIENFRPGSYEIRISFIGYNTLKLKNIMVTPDEPNYSAGDLKLKTGDEFTTTEIQVTAEQNLMEMGVDKKVFNVEKDINSQSGSVTDVLKNIPSVTVDADGKVSLRGSGNVRILINGKPSGLLSSDPNAVLEQIPANTVERIEIMNNPTAKFDPEGMAGIINIILKKSKTETNNGYNYNISVNAGTGDKYNLSTGLSYRTGKLNIYGNYGFRLFHMNMNGTSDRTYLYADTLHNLLTTDNNYAKMLGHLGTVGFDYDISKNSYLGLSVSYSNRDRNRNENALYRNYDINNLPSLFYKRKNYDNEKEDGLDANLNFKQKFEKKFQELDASVQFSSSNEKNTQNINQNNQDFNGNDLNTATIRENDYTNEKFYSLSVQADYTHPLREDPVNKYKLASKFELGFKSQFRKTDNDFSVENFDTLAQIFIPNNFLSNNFIYNEQVHAIYGTYENNIKKFGYQLGLRLEETITNSEQRVTNTKYDRNYFSYFPSLFLKQGIANDLELQLSFTRRINRPRLGMLNPFIDYSDPQNLRRGNPDLKPEYINGLEFGVVKYFTTISITSSAFYRITEDVITRYTEVDTSGITISSMANLDKAKSYGVELIGTGSLFKWWFINASASYFRTDLSGSINSAEMNNSGYSWTGKLVSNMTLPNLFDIQLSYFYMGRSVSAQGSMEPIQSLDLAVKKDFLNKRMSLGFRVSDIFNSQKYSFSQNTNLFTVASSRKRDSRALFLTFTYRIGSDDKKQERRKKPQQEENRDNEGQDY